MFKRNKHKSKPVKMRDIHLPDHDPELVEIIEETISLQEKALEDDKEFHEHADNNRQREAHQNQKEGSNPFLRNTQADQISKPVFLKDLVHMNTTSVEQHTLQDRPKTHEEILAKNTNYIFIFGYTGAGKSTVLTAINMYMRQHYRVILNQAENQDGIRLIHQMMRDVEEGQFPLPTSIGMITEYDTAFRMEGEDVNLTFLEMAGEDLKKVDVETGEEGLPEAVRAYLTCPNISISFLLVADFDRVVSKKEDKLILQFLSYLYNEKIDLSRVGVVLSKFDRGRTDMDVEEVIQTHLPQVDKWLTSGDIAQPRVFPFSIGKIKEYSNRKDEIEEINLEDCSELVPWLHTVLSLPGARPAEQKSGMMGKLKNFLKK